MSLNNWTIGFQKTTVICCFVSLGIVLVCDFQVKGDEPTIVTKIRDLGLKVKQKESNGKLTYGISLHGDQLDITAMKYLRQLPEVHYLGIVGGRIDADKIDFLDCHVQLKQLALLNCEIRDTEFIKLKNLPKLESLSLHSPKQLTWEGLDNVERFRALRSLTISNVPVTGKGLDVLSQMPMLISLDLRGCHLRDIDRRNLRNLKRLRMVWLDGCKVCDLLINALLDLPDLHTVSLEKSTLNNQQLETLTQHSNLSTIWATNSRVTKELVSQLRLEKPMLDIHINK